MNSKNTFRALLGSVLAITLCLTMLVGTTFAWFTDKEVTGVNTIVAGNLDIELEYLNEDGEWEQTTNLTKLFGEAETWEPGHTEVAYLKVTNAGSLALNYRLAINVSNEVAGTNVAGEEFNLSDYLEFGIVESATEIEAYETREDAQAAVNGKTNKLQSYSKNGALETEDELYLALVVFMPTSVGNVANYKTDTVAPSVELGVTLFATQQMSEDDSFNNEYDEDAKDAFIVASTAADLTDAFNLGKDVILAADITLDAGLTLAAGNTVVLDLNGYVISYNSALTTGNAAITNNGTLTISDTVGTGVITYNSTAPDSGYGTHTISNNGTLTVNGGSVINTTPTGVTYAIDNNSSIRDAIFTLNGGTVTGVKTAVRQFANSTTSANTVTVNAGTVSAEYAGVWMHLPHDMSVVTLNINGGTVSGESYSFYTYNFDGNDDGFDNAVINVTGGTVSGWGFLYANETLNVNGGTLVDGITCKSDVNKTVSDAYDMVYDGSKYYDITNK